MSGAGIFLLPEATSPSDTSATCPARTFRVSPSLAVSLPSAHTVSTRLALATSNNDRDAYRRNEAQIAREKEIMKDVPGWEAGKSVYNTKRYTPPNFVVL
ncbi:hypothetical protein [Sporisorium scitamineum]|uniref:NADH dehydrogenase [ubiquinone] 1 alpha subcomplex subunit 13 n=1 Tax=Sporisorium scitamineum TaxID=49012 RepID=A0A0F7RV48_9BASI|nr:hypothetical protein [Sporisorium scitamineum]